LVERRHGPHHPEVVRGRVILEAFDGPSEVGGLGNSSLGDIGDFSLECAVFADKAANRDAPPHSREDFQGVVRKSLHFHQLGERSDIVQIIERRIVHGGIFLGR
jgi:hypothetical protein